MKKEIKNIVTENITRNCVSSKQDIEAAVAARVNALEIAENENATENEIALANREAREAELRLSYKANALVVIFENGSREALAQKGNCASAQRALGEAFAAATDAVNNAVHLDKLAVKAALACTKCTADELEAAEDKADSAATEAAIAKSNLTAEELAVFEAIIAAKENINNFLMNSKSNFNDKLGLDLGEVRKGFVECSILGLDRKAIGNKVSVTYKKVNGSIRDIRKA